LEIRVTALATDDNIVVVEAKGVAATVASRVASQHAAAFARQIGILDESIRHFGRRPADGSDRKMG